MIRIMGTYNPIHVLITHGRKKDKERRTVQRKRKEEKQIDGR
jgi:hypothetical protein